MPRYRNTKERKQDRQEFIYKWRKEIADFFELDGWGYYCSNQTAEWVEAHARPELGYNPKTQTGSIWRTIAMEYYHMKEKNLF